jgi:hypothetical protein
VVAAVLALGLIDTNGIIAEYNVDRYLAGEVERAGRPDKPETIDLSDPLQTAPILEAPELRPDGPALVDSIDVDFLARLGDPAVPALFLLKEKARDTEVVWAATQAIEDNYSLRHTFWIDGKSQPKPWTAWPEWNLAYHRAAQLYEVSGFSIE